MKVLVACEFSGRVRDAFLERGHDAVSCDLLPTESLRGPHYQGPVEDLISDGWDLMIAHPPCTFLACSGNRWANDPGRQDSRRQAIDFFMMLANSDIPKICIENPVGIMSTRWRKPDQYIQPYEYGDPTTKKTGLWLKGLPKLTPTDPVTPVYVTTKDGKRYSEIHHASGWMDREKQWRFRSRTFPGIAQAMAEQWGSI